jgi:hypothetical protein
MDWLTEAAKQVPALAVLIGLVVYFLKHLSSESQKSEERLKAVVTSQSETIRSLETVLAANNAALANAVLLLTMLDSDLKNAVRKSGNRSAG